MAGTTGSAAAPYLAAARFSVAPMMDWTDTHCRTFHRILTRRALLYTEMVTTGAIIHGPRARLLAHDASEHPVALQLGGSDPAELAEAVRIAEDFGYDEINLNCGCPSDRVQNGRFGACLMREPELVGRCVAAMKRVTALPVTVKCRIGVDDQEPEAALSALVDAVVASGVDGVIVHARKAWLKGLSPKENRDVPPLDYPLVHALKRRRPGLFVAINGGVADNDAAAEHLAHLDGVMLGRAAYHTPELLLDVDARFFGAERPVADAFAAVELFLPYMERKLREGVRLRDMTRHLLGLFTGQGGARAWRRHLATEAVKAGAGIDVVRDALAKVSRHPDLGRAA
ncbi:tRNA dihydrouridine(20/20a) synthase DusA [Lichenibacterium dinghuense]|uniref:tRNA dihydrouridine(20/20a) synthase DusA n=1 Tax=Lichenibacterium dinghuense TaxID=2895977 RepID=UPI001F020962|nr:tRNA dihydrouridine(20/20a) synthase DusA [Lichenibacterium sp. 6Y81]